jgi:hypothetical protein
MNHHARNVLCGCVIAWAALTTIGCFRVAPKMPPPLASMAPINYSSSALDADVATYHASIANHALDNAKTQRNQIVFRIIAQIDAAYGAFELNLSTRRAGLQTGGDAAQLGLSAAATLVGASDIKDILSATSTAFQGTRLSVDKNFYEQKTTESLVSQMRASRKNLQAQILLSLSNRDVNSYPLESAWGDVVNYYYAGTIPSALVDIAGKAGNDAVKADQTLKDAVKELTPATPDQAKQALTIRSEYEALNKAVSSGNETSVKAAGETLARILTNAKIQFDPSASASNLLEVFKQAIIATANDNAKLQTLDAAVKSVASQ